MRNSQNKALREVLKLCKYMRLVLPSVKYQQSYLEALKEAEEEKSLTTLRKIKEGETFEQFAENIVKMDPNLPPKKRYWIKIN